MQPARRLLAAAALFASAATAWTTTLPPQDTQAVPPRVQQLADDIATELAARCPVAPAGDIGAYTACRRALFGDSALRAALSPVILWGRQKNPDATLRQTNLTQFAPDVWTNMYAPLFMFNGKHTVEWVAHERKFLVRLEAAFRNRLPPGQFPYPFWHEEDKWATYENANGVMLWVDPNSAKVQAAQFTRRAPNAMLQAVQPVQHAFDGKGWMWTDAQGRTQPAVTLFDGVYRADNPYLRSLDRQYRDLALTLRESQCMNCHTPENRDKMSRLVLLSTPAHAAGEIERLIKAVKEDRMPVDEVRIAQPLADDAKKWLLDSAEVFRSTWQAARDWEQQARRKPGELAAGGTAPMEVLK